jgi:hypothetical protein
MARVGYGLQGHPGEMLSVLAQAAVPANYEVRTGKFRGTVADLVESEKRTCRGGDELAHKLSGMAFYARNGETWKNALGEEWSVERLLAEEIKRSPAVDGPDVTEQLMALSFAIERRTRAAKPLDGPYGQAQKYVAQFRDHAFKLQNADGSWHPGFFAFKGSGRDVPGQLRSTGHILQWLVYSLPEDRLDDPKVVKSVTYVTGLLTDSYSRWNATATTPREIDSVAHALHALRIYDRRAFRPLDPVAPPAAEKAAPGEAKTSRTAQRVPGSR